MQALSQKIKQQMDANNIQEKAFDAKQLRQAADIVSKAVEKTGSAIDAARPQAERIARVVKERRGATEERLQQVGSAGGPEDSPVDARIHPNSPVKSPAKGSNNGSSIVPSNRLSNGLSDPEGPNDEFSQLECEARSTIQKENFVGLISVRGHIRW